MTDALYGLTAIITLGFAARWIAWKSGLPAILLLLAAGMAAGPLLGWVQPDRLLGDALLPVVSVSVAIILFEGGLGLRLSELKEGGAVRNLVTVGVLVTWLLSTALAAVTIGLSWQVALLLGAILTVTGPTVILPLLQHIRPKGQVAAVARWEGILIDPVGALLAVLAYEAILGKVLDGWSTDVVWHYFSGILIGTLAGGAAAAIVVLALHRFLIPDSLLTAFSLAAVIGTFTASNHIREETGLVAVTVAGILLANQKWVSVHHILEFKENLRTILISSLFILLAARIRPGDLTQLGGGVLAFIAGLVLIVRPASVFFSTIGSGLHNGERAFLAGLAPRGIVAAAVSSILAEKLAAAGVEQARALVPIVFSVVIATVAIYGLGAGPLARWLNIAEGDPQGLLIAGCHPKMLELAELLRREGFAVAFVDSDWGMVSRARLKGFRATYGNPASEEDTSDTDLQGIGKALLFTPHGDTNALAALRFSRIFGRAHTYQVRTGRDPTTHLAGRFLFSPGQTFDALERLFEQGYSFKATPLTARFGAPELIQMYGPTAVPFFHAAGNGKLTVLASGLPAMPFPDGRVISLVPPDAAAAAPQDHNRHAIPV